MTEYEVASLWAQWVGSGSAALAVVVAAVFGYLTLGNNRRSKDAQQRATMIAAMDKPNQQQSLVAQHPRVGRATLSIRHQTGETWLLINEGPNTVYMVQIDGLTDLDKRRLRAVALEPASLSEGQAKEFVLASRFTLSGPANVVISYRLKPGGSELRRVLEVPAP